MDKNERLTCTPYTKQDYEMVQLLSDLSGNTLSGTPSQEHVGTHDINITVSDDNGGIATQSFTLTVNNVNDAPNGTVIIEGDTKVDQNLTVINTLKT